MLRQPLLVVLMVLGLTAAGCGFNPAAPPRPPQDKCVDSDGPGPETVGRAIAAVPPAAGGAAWIETARGYTRNCRLYWVKLSPRDAKPAGPEQLLFFDHDKPLGSPTPNPKPYTTVLTSGAESVTVQYQWRIGRDRECCPTGAGTTRYRIGPDGRLKAVDPIPWPRSVTDPPVLSYGGQAQLPPGATFGGTVVGGLSGISYDPGRDLYYLISDDRSQMNPARFYTAKITLSDNGIRAVTITGTHPWRDESAAPPVVPPDPEGIAFDAARQRLYWSSEGERITDRPGPPVLADPFVRIAALDGRYLGRFSIPPGLAMSAQQTGPRRNAALEGLTLAPDGRLLFAGMEEPRYDDGDPPTADRGALTRITAFDVESTTAVAQYAYPLEPAAPGARSNGLTDLVALSGTVFLVIERSFGERATVRLFVAGVDDATDVLRVPSLTGARVTPMRKTLLADLTAVPGLSPLDNIEGITLGPRLPDGRQSVLLVSDDNFSPRQVTQFLLFAMS